MERPIEWYQEHWRELELANDRSPASGRAWKGLKQDRDGRPPTQEEWAALARFTKLNRYGVDFRTAYEHAYGRDAGPEVDRLAQRLLDAGVLVVGGVGSWE